MTSVPNSTVTSYDLLVDALYAQLSNCRLDSIKHGPVNVRPDAKDILVFDPRKYYDRAYNYHAFIIAALEKRDYPPFPINQSDVSLATQRELVRLPSFQLQSVLKETILRIFKDIDEDYNSVFELEERKKSGISYQGRLLLFSKWIG